MSYWLFKSEPDSFSIDDLMACPEQTEPWDGIRNYQARNFLRDQVKLGDQLFFYHSSCKQVGIVGVATVVKEAYPDPSQFNPDSKYFDPKSSSDNPRWVMVDVRFQEKFEHILTLQSIKTNPQITEIGLVKKGHRLSIMPVTDTEWAQLYQMVKSQMVKTS